VSEHLFLRLADSADRVTMTRLNADGQLLRRPATLSFAEAAAYCNDAPITALLPAHEIVSCVALLPAAATSRMRQMLPFSLEDEFAGDVEDLHFALGDRNDAGQFAVSVIARDRVDNWLAVLGAAGIVPRRLCSEADGVPDTPGVTNLLVEGHRILGRRPNGAPFVFEGLGLSEVWQLLQAEREDTADLAEVVLFIDSETLRERGAEIDAWRSGVANVSLKELADGLLPRLAATLVFREGPNLLQGRYAPRSNYGSLFRPWRVAALFLLVVIGVAFVGTAAEAWKLKQNDDQLRAEIETICRASYALPDERSCRLEMQRRIAVAGDSAGSASGFLDTLAAVADASGDAVRIDGLNFRENVLDLDLIVPNMAFLDTFNDGVASAGDFRVRVQSNASEGDGFKTRLQIVSVEP
jgi:general secretion pathway protein L